MAKPENKPKIKMIAVDLIILVPFLTLYALYWVQFTMDVNNYLLTFRPELEALSTIESIYWVVGMMTILFGLLFTPVIVGFSIIQSFTRFIAIKMKWKKKTSHCNVCDVPLKQSDTVLIVKYVAYHYSCYDKTRSNKE